jgi:acyl-CoA synthetase (AMP-forming)/AMP-acid ligase II
MDTASLLTTSHVAPEAARTYREHGHWRDDTYLVDRAGGDRHEITAADLADRVERVAQGLRAAGVRAREAVATGDLAEVDDSGELAFVDRDSDEIKGASGMLIPTADVEDLVVSHPDVQGGRTWSPVPEGVEAVPSEGHLRSI